MPPHSEPPAHVSTITDGIEMIIVVIWKKLLSVVPMPVRNMWCAHTTSDMPPSAATARPSARSPTAAGACCAVITSATMPIAGRTST